MKLTQVRTVTFDTQEVIIAATLSAPDEWIILLSSGNVVRFNAANATSQHLFVASDIFSYPDEGFKIGESCSIYTLDQAVVVVNNYRRHGFLHYPGKHHKVHLWRGEYHVNVTKYPIALYNNEAGVPHMVYAEDWNHLQIMNIDTQRIITAAKSLIKEGAEEGHIEFYSKNEELTQHPWPRPYDYFYGELLMSPDGKQFLSKGWVWGSADSYHVFDVADFITNPRIRFKRIGIWGHENRAACWIDDSTVAIAYDPATEDSENKPDSTAIEVHLYDVSAAEPTLTKRLVTELESMPKNIYYYSDLNALVVIQAKPGITVIDLDGKSLLTDNTIDPITFYPQHGQFISYNEHIIRIDKLVTG